VILSPIARYARRFRDEAAVRFERLSCPAAAARQVAGPTVGVARCGA
jgi:hypothetical protein